MASICVSRMWKTLILFCAILPSSVHAAVVISEVAWMGSAESANDEWIELYNTGSDAVSVDNWRVNDGASINVELSGAIAAGAYAVLERTDDTSAPGPAFATYTGALSNAGATLFLYRADGTLEDTVAGGSDWENIGGDNQSKYTPQYTGSGWITAPASPGGAASAMPTTDGENTETESAAQEHDDKGDPVTIELQPSNNELVLGIEVSPVAYVNQEITLTAEASGIGKTLLDSLTYTWNFGDLETASGKEVPHSYAHPGTYVITLHSAFARYDEVVRATITVLPVKFEMERMPHGDILLRNNAKYETDISGYTLKGSTTLTFPTLSFIAPQGTIKIPYKYIGSKSGNAFLYDQRANMVASLGVSSASHSPESVQPNPVVHTETVPAVTSREISVEPVAAGETAELENFSFSTDVTTSAESGDQYTQLALVADVPKTPQSETRSTPSRWNVLSLFGLCGVVAIGLFAVLFTKPS